MEAEFLALGANYDISFWEKSNRVICCDYQFCHCPDVYDRLGSGEASTTEEASRLAYLDWKSKS